MLRFRKINLSFLIFFVQLSSLISKSIRGDGNLFKKEGSCSKYILLRSDLLKEMGWSIGSLVAQACHASSAVLHLFKDDEYTLQYLSDLDNMHKVVLEVPNEHSLRKVAEKLKENAISHKLWIEQPENIPTCLAIKPYPKDEIKKFVGKYKLYKDTMSS